MAWGKQRPLVHFLGSMRDLFLKRKQHEELEKQQIVEKSARPAGSRWAWLAVGMLLAPLALWTGRVPAGPVPQASVTPPPDPRPLAGLVILVDPGHGGYDGGAVGAGGIIEKDLNLQLSLVLAELLEAQGAKAVLTRDGDYALCDDTGTLTQRKRQDMARRADIMKGEEAVLVLSIHMNKYRDKSCTGPQVFFQKGDERSAELARTIQAALIEGVVPKWEREAAPGDFYMLRQGPLAVLVESGFISNVNEAKLLADPDYQRRFAQAIVEGVIRHRTENGEPWLTEYPKEAVALI